MTSKNMFRPAVSQAACSSWARRLGDGRILLISIVDESPLIDGVNDAVVRTVIEFSAARDETQGSIGKTWIDIVEQGWKSIPGTNAIAMAIAALG